MRILADIDIPFVKDYFGSCGELVLKPGRAIVQHDLVNADLLLVRSVTQVNAALLQGTTVKFVGSVASGIDHLDVQWLEQAGILWRSANGYNAVAVADYVMSAIAALYPSMPAPQLKTGVVGVGQIGSLVAERFKKFGFDVLVCDPPRAKQEAAFNSSSLAAFGDRDLVSLHMPLTDDGAYPTHHLIDAGFLSRAQQNAILLNTGRGAVVDAAALESCPKRWQFCFDVWEKEPEISRTNLAKALLATPHLAGHSIQSRYRGIHIIYQAVVETQMIDAHEPKLPVFPQQIISFDNKQVTWQDVVLAIFDPRVVTREMKEVLLKGPEKCATLFDKLRQQYIGNSIRRHEFAYTTVCKLRLAEQDRHLLLQLGIHIEE